MAAPSLWAKGTAASTPDHPDHPDHPPPEYSAQRKLNPSSSSKPEICRSWDTPQGCTQKQRDCSHGTEHKCSFLVQGEPCLKRNHNAVTHSRWVADERRNSSQPTRKTKMKQEELSLSWSQEGRAAALRLPLNRKRQQHQLIQKMMMQRSQW